MQSEQQQRIMGYFIEEAKDHLNTLEQGLLNLQSTIADPDLVHEVFRAAHSVKGGAAMLGLDSIQKTAHRLEDYFKVLKECPVQVDQKLESLFLRVFDTLQELLEQLQGPFGLTDDNAVRIMSEVEPVLGQLNAHLNHLVNESGGDPPAEVDLSTAPVSSPPRSPSTASSAPASTAEDSALQLYFQSDVPAQLRTMLQLMKQAETPGTRHQLQDICVELAQAGDSFDLPPTWNQLASTAQRAIANPDNSFRTLAPSIIKDFKQAQEQVLAGQANAIAVSDTLQSLAPITDVTPEISEIDDLFGDSDNETESAASASDADEIGSDLFDDLEDTASGESTDFDDFIESFEADSSAFTDTAALDSSPSNGSNNGLHNGSSYHSDRESDESLEDIDSFLDLDSTDESTTAATEEPRTADLDLEELGTPQSSSGSQDPHNGPEVGVAELNSLADLFEHESPELAMDWQEEVIQDSSDLLEDELELDDSSDFSDLLFDDNHNSATSSEPLEDVSDLLDIEESEDHEVTTSTNSGELDEFFEMGAISNSDEGALLDDLSSDTPSDADPEMSELDNLGAFFSQTDEDVEEAAADLSSADSRDDDLRFASSDDLDFAGELDTESSDLQALTSEDHLDDDLDLAELDKPLDQMSFDDSDDLDGLFDQSDADEMADESPFPSDESAMEDFDLAFDSEEGLGDLSLSLDEGAEDDEADDAAAPDTTADDAFLDFDNLGDELLESEVDLEGESGSASTDASSFPWDSDVGTDADTDAGTDADQDFDLNFDESFLTNDKFSSEASGTNNISPDIQSTGDEQDFDFDVDLFDESEDNLSAEALDFDDDDGMLSAEPDADFDFDFASIDAESAGAGTEQSEHGADPGEFELDADFLESVSFDLEQSEVSDAVTDTSESEASQEGEVIALGTSDSDADLELQDLLEDTSSEAAAASDETPWELDSLSTDESEDAETDLDQLFGNDSSLSEDELALDGLDEAVLTDLSDQFPTDNEELDFSIDADADIDTVETTDEADIANTGLDDADLEDLSDDIWGKAEETPPSEEVADMAEAVSAGPSFPEDTDESDEWGDIWSDAENSLSSMSEANEVAATAEENSDIWDDAAALDNIFEASDLEEPGVDAPDHGESNAATLDESDGFFDGLDFEADLTSEPAASDENFGDEDFFGDENFGLDSLVSDANSDYAGSELDRVESSDLDEAAIALDDMLESSDEDAATDWDLSQDGGDGDDFDLMLGSMDSDGEDENPVDNEASALSIDFDDDFGDLDTMLGDSETDAQEMASDDISSDGGSDELSDDLLDNDLFGDAEILDTPHPDHEAAVDEADNGDGFDDLEALLDESVAVPDSEASSSTDSEARASGAANDEFDDLEALLDDAPISTIPDDDDGGDGSDDDDFADLEKLLEDADQKLGGSPTAKAARGPSPGITRRPARRPSNFTDQTMRVPVKNLDNLNNLVGELVVNRNSLEQSQERLRQFLDNLLYQVQQLSDVGQRMRDLYERSLLESSLLSSRRTHQIATAQAANTAAAAAAGADTHATGASFDALEMDRFTGFHTLSQEMIELIVRVREAASDIDFVVDESDQITRMFRQVTTQLQEGLTRSRMVPFAQAASRLPRAVRDISIKCGKQAELVIEGKDTLIDKMILEQLYDPMTHLVNNAITHGIETPDERQSIGKTPTGKITIRVFHQGNQTIISVTDDGAGIDPDRVKQKAIQRGLIMPEEADEMSDLETYDLLFHHGFSTRDQADDFAGRGVGMDVVRTSLNEIRGVINIDSVINQGTTFTIRLPLTLSISKALLCVSNRARIAFPMDGVEDMLDVPRERIQDDDQGRPCIQWRDIMLPFQPLADLLKYNRSMGRGSVYGGNQEDDVISVIVLRSTGNYLALQVDQVLGEQEIVIKQLEAPVPKPAGIAGATVLGDGRIMPIADVLELIDLSMGRIRRESGSSLWDQEAKVTPPQAHDAKSEPTVLIVDDSITVRELLSMTFNKVGYRVEQARDGQEAWEKLKSGLPCDLVFCDIEMPRMDGLELLSRLQKDGHLKDLPIAMLTSRGADRHRQMAVQLGAKGYFTKPYLEEALLDAAQRMLNGEVLVSA